MAALTLGISATFPIELYAEVEKYATEQGFTDKDGPKRGTAVTQLVAKALNFDLPKPAASTETPEQKKAREKDAQTKRTNDAKAALVALKAQNGTAATQAQAQANSDANQAPAATGGRH